MSYKKGTYLKKSLVPEPTDSDPSSGLQVSGIAIETTAQLKPIFFCLESELKIRSDYKV